MKNFLVINTSFFGDVILTGSLCNGIKLKYPNSKVIFMVNKPFFEAARYLEGVDEVIEYDKKGKNKGIKGFFSFYSQYKNFYKDKIEAAFIIYGNERGIILAKLWRANIILSDNSGVIRFLPNYKRLKIENEMHVQDRNLTLLSLYKGTKIDALPVRYYPPIEAEKSINELLRRKINSDFSEHIAICATSKKIEKDMPLNTCVHLIEYLKRKVNVLFIGTGEIVTNYTENLRKAGVKEFIDLVNCTSISELGALLKRCKAIISVDTGTLHFACALQVPVVALFYINDKEHIRKWAPKNFYIHRLLVGKEIEADSIIKKLEEIQNDKN